MNVIKILTPENKLKIIHQQDAAGTQNTSENVHEILIQYTITATYILTKKAPAPRLRVSIVNRLVHLARLEKRAPPPRLRVSIVNRLVHLARLENKTGVLSTKNAI